MQASLGIAHVIDATISTEELIRSADLAMYKAKAKAERRGGIATFHDDLLEAARRRLDLRTCVRRPTGELSLVYQPLVKLAATSAVVSAEALLPWCRAPGSCLRTITQRRSRRRSPRTVSLRTGPL